MLLDRQELTFETQTATEAGTDFGDAEHDRVTRFELAIGFRVACQLHVHSVCHRGHWAAVENRYGKRLDSALFPVKRTGLD